MSILRAYSKLTVCQRLKIVFHYILPQLCLTKLAGWLAQRQWGWLTHWIISIFARCYQVNWQEAEYTQAKDYASFNAFFTRALKPGARPICDGEENLCLPADGRISECGVIEQNYLLQAKGHSFTLMDLLAGDETLARDFENGLFVTTYLSPRDYHRVHMPCDAVLRKMIYVPGDLFSVNPFLAKHIPNLFARNERVICVFDTDFGQMVQILVGATITASIRTTWAGVVNPPRTNYVRTWQYPDSGEGVVRFHKGDEMGAFQLGSTVINLFPKGAVTLAEKLETNCVVKMGEQLATLNRV